MLNFSAASSPHSKNLSCPESASHKRLLSLLPVVEKYGFCLLPLCGKRPAIKDWPSKASSDPKVLHHWTAAYKSANWGIATGKKSGITAIDIDGDWALSTLKELEQQHGTLPGPRVKTGGGGLHLYFKYSADLPNGLRVSRQTEKGEFLICGDGRQLVASGSIHPDTGQFYEWVEGRSPLDLPIPPIPGWLSAWLLSNRGNDTKRKSDVDKAMPFVENETALVEEGSRNHELHAWICEFVFRVLNAGESLDIRCLLEEAKKVNQVHFSPPYSDDELFDRVHRSTLRAQEDWQSSSKSKRVGLRKVKGTKPSTDKIRAWEPPVTFDAHSGPAFPTECLNSSKWLRNFVNSVSTAFQVPPEMPAMLTLAMLAGALQKIVTVSPRSGWIEPLPLYVCISADPGTNKSQIHNLVVSPLLAWENQKNLETANQRRSWATELRILTNRIERLEKRAANVDDAAERTKIVEQIAGMRAEMEIIPSGAPLQWIYDDATSEILEKGMGQNQEIAILTSAEGRVFDQLSGASSDGRVNLNIFLKAHCGDELRVNRVTREPVFLKKPLLTIAVMTQPDVVAGLAAKRELAGRGLLARFAFVVPASNVGRRSIDVPHVDMNVRQVYVETLQQILEAGFTEEEICLRYDVEAAAAFSEFRKEIEARLDPSANDLNGLSSWASKLAGLTARLSGVLHVAQNIECWREKDIVTETLADAVQISRYLIEHARVAFGLMGADTIQTDARYLMEVMLRAAKRNDGSAVKRYELWQLTKRHFRTAESLNRALEVLESRNIIHVCSEPSTGAKPTEVYYINPAMLSDKVTLEVAAPAKDQPEVDCEAAPGKEEKK